MDEVETHRLVLRRWRTDDVAPLARIFAKPEVWWFPFRRGWSAAETQAFVARRLHDWDTRGWSQWAVESKEGGELIGFAGLAPPEFLPEVMPTVEVGWRLDPDHWGRGYATETGDAALAFGFGALDLDEIVSIYEPDNVASGRVMQRLGMTRHRDTRHPELGVPLRVYRIERGEWEVKASRGAGR